MPRKSARLIAAPDPGAQSFRWTFVEEARTEKGRRSFLCRCECGTERLLAPVDFLDGRTKSCGCFNVEASRERATKHGRRHTALYQVWLRMRQRCSNPNATGYSHYGGRGIVVCAEWDASFEAFRAWALGAGYLEGATFRQEVDRIDNDGPYAPDNCRIVTPKPNRNNTRGNRMVTAFGETKSMMAWSEDPRCAVTYYALRNRLSQSGWPAEAAILASPNTRLASWRPPA
jgi:hypothetical protein